MDRFDTPLSSALVGRRQLLFEHPLEFSIDLHTGLMWGWLNKRTDVRPELGECPFQL